MGCCLCTNGCPLAASAITHGLLLVTDGLLRQQKQPMGDQFQFQCIPNRESPIAANTSTYPELPHLRVELILDRADLEQELRHRQETRQ